MKPSDLEEMPLRMERMYYDLQNRIMTDVVRRIRKTGGITSTADYQLYKVEILGGSTEFIESEIKRVMELSDAEVWELYDKAAEQEYTRDKAVYEQINSNFIPYSKNEVLQSWTQAVVKQTQNDIKNISRSLGMMVSIGAGKSAFTPLAEYYQKYLDRACLDVVAGSFSYNTVLRRVVKEMTASGIRSVDYATGWSNRAPVAVRRAVMTGVNQLAGQINEKVASDLGTNDYEVTWHSGARPDHWWGGMVFSNEELHSVCHLGDVTGLCGANCRHSYIPFIKGISVRTYTDEQLEELNAKEKEVHTWAGKEYNTYEATQKQRQMETIMRAQRSKIDLLKKGGADKQDVIAAQCRYQTNLHQYQGFCSKMELKPQMERVYMDGLGRVAGGRTYKKIITGGEKRVIIKVQKTTAYANPDSITQITGKQGGVTRNYYDQDGKWYKQITNNNHGNKKQHPYGKNGEHAHDILWSNGKIVDRPARELSELERKENGDIL